MPFYRYLYRYNDNVNVRAEVHILNKILKNDTHIMVDKTSLIYNYVCI